MKLSLQACLRGRRWAWAAVVVGLAACGSPTRVWAIDADISGAPNQSYYVYYDTNSVVVGSPVHVHIVGSVDGDVYHSCMAYNRSWEGGSASFSFDSNGAWGADIMYTSSIDRWVTFTPTAAGTFKVGVEFTSFPDFDQAHAFINFTAYPPSAVITSATSASRNQGQDAAYQIVAINSPTSYGASGLPAGASVNTSTGYISGRLTGSGTVSSTMTATNGVGGQTVGLTWNITAASITPSASVSPSTTWTGSSVTLTRAGTTNFGLAWTENTIWRPVSGAQALGNASFGSSSYTPADGPGTYWYQIRLVDIYSNYQDQWISFTVTEPVTPPTTVGTTSIGSYSVALSWSGATAAAGINHYNVYRNGTLIGTTAGTTYTDSTAQPGTTYSYTVKTVDNGSGLSAVSAAAGATTALSFEIFTPLP